MTQAASSKTKPSTSKRRTEAERARALLAVLTFPETIDVGEDCVGENFLALATAVANDSHFDPDWIDEDGMGKQSLLALALEIVCINHLEKIVAVAEASADDPVRLGRAARHCCHSSDSELKNYGGWALSRAVGGDRLGRYYRDEVYPIDEEDAARVLVLGVLMHLAGPDAGPRLYALKPLN
jgi:hypothetical protein